MSKNHHGDGDQSFTSGDQNGAKAKCTHIDRAVDLYSVIISANTSGVHTDCEDCKKQPLSDLAELELRQGTSLLFPEPQFSSLWFCLRCGNQACGRFKNMHALMHFQASGLDFHCLCVDTTSWRIWCYSCHKNINVTCNKVLQEAVEYLKQVKSNPKKQVATRIIADKVVMDENFVFPSLESSPIYKRLLSAESRYILKFCGYQDGFTIAKANSDTFLCDMEGYVRGKNVPIDLDHRISIVIPEDFKFKPGEAIKIKELQKDFRNRLNINVP